MPLLPRLQTPWLDLAGPLYGRKGKRREGIKNDERK